MPQPSTDSIAAAARARTDSILAAVPAPDPHSYDLPAGFVQADAPGLVTSIVDSIGADTVQGRIPHFIPVEEADSLRVEAFIDSLGTHTVIPEVPSGSSEGLAPMAKAPSYSGGTALPALLIGTLVIAAMSAKGISRALKSYSHELWGVRRRRNAFDEERSVSLPMAALLSLVFIVFGGIVLYNVPGYPPSPSFAGAAASMALLGIYYCFELVAYSLVGYAFAGKEASRQWLNGFMATQAWCGLFLIVPALLMVYEPTWRQTLVIVSVAIYFIARVIFIAKGLRIFYHNFRSLLYFILYLCTLEIIPVLVIYALSVYLRGFTA